MIIYDLCLYRVIRDSRYEREIFMGQNKKGIKFVLIDSLLDIIDD